MLGEKDAKILEELRRNGRESTVMIARRTHLPRVTVHDRIEKMKKRGLIRRFTVLPDYAELGQGVTSHVLVAYTPCRTPQRKVAEEIARLPGVYEVSIIAGEWDMLVKIRGASLEAIGKLIVDKMRKIEGVGRTLSLPCFELIKEEV